MICALGFHAGDYAKARSLLSWTNELGPCREHELLLVADAGLSRDSIRTLAESQKPHWKTVTAITNNFPVSGWIAGSNSLFLEAAKWCEQYERNGWLWLETDCVPVKAGWLDAIDAEYKQADKSYLGYIYGCNGSGLPSKLMSGIAVYPASTYGKARDVVKHDVAFDVALADIVVPHAVHSRTIKHIWGTPRYPPRFYSQLPVQPLPNSFTKALLGDCVLFHRVKDTSLIDLLRGKPSKKMVRWMVWPFCNKDAATALKNLRWMGELGRYDWNLVLSYPTNTVPRMIQMMREAGRCFASIADNSYDDRVPGWPPNVAFSHAARFMANFVKEPWLWMEPDAVPLKAGWLDKLRQVYADCPQNFAAPHVQGMKHCNGTGIYPADTPDRIPRAINERSDAWDTAMADEMMHDCFDLMPVFFHCWTMDADNFYSCGGGGNPTFPDQRMVDKIPSEAVVFHRNKDLTLIDRLKERSK